MIAGTNAMCVKTVIWMKSAVGRQRVLNVIFHNMFNKKLCLFARKMPAEQKNMCVVLAQQAWLLLLKIVLLVCAMKLPDIMQLVRRGLLANLSAQHLVTATSLKRVPQARGEIKMLTGVMNLKDGFSVLQQTHTLYMMKHQPLILMAWR